MSYEEMANEALESLHSLRKDTALMYVIDNCENERVNEINKSICEHIERIEAYYIDGLGYVNTRELTNSEIRAAVLIATEE